MRVRPDSRGTGKAAGPPGVALLASDWVVETAGQELEWVGLCSRGWAAASSAVARGDVGWYQRPLVQLVGLEYSS